MEMIEHVKTAQKARTLLFDAYVEFLDGDWKFFYAVLDRLSEEKTSHI